MTRKNEDLKSVYDRVYKEGEEQFFTRFTGGKDLSETNQRVLAATDWEGRSVLDVGCGTGLTAYLIAQIGARQVAGIDFSEEAIKIARESHQASNLVYHVMDVKDWSDPVDVIVSCGTIEHMDDPAATLHMMGKWLGLGGEMVITCPHFLNIRGFIWMALATLLDVPMSLTDLHFIAPFDVEAWLENSHLEIASVETFDHSRGNGEIMLVDMRKRLTNALRDAGMDNSKVEDFIGWLEKVVQYRQETGALPLDGANALYRIRRSGGAS